MTDTIESTTLHGGPLDEYQPPPEQALPDDWSYIGLDGLVHRYLKNGADYQYQGSSEYVQQEMQDTPLPELPAAAPPSVIPDDLASAVAAEQARQEKEAADLAAAQEEQDRLNAEQAEAARVLAEQIQALLDQQNAEPTPEEPTPEQNPEVAS